MSICQVVIIALFTIHIIECAKLYLALGSHF